MTYFNVVISLIIVYVQEVKGEELGECDNLQDDQSCLIIG